jgi:hypothetical protein
MTEHTTEGFGRLKRLVPASVKDALKDALRERRWRHALRRASSLSPGERPSRELLAELQAGWGNESYAARTDYLEEVAARGIETRGHVLECGSGLTSVLLGLTAGRRGFETWSLEHHAEWRGRVEGALRRGRIDGVRVCHAPLKSYGGFDWYDPPALEMPEEFTLVVCDGPPGMTKGGRYGLLPVMRERLHAGAVILLDDAEREGEADVLSRWAEEARLTNDMRETPTGAYAVLTLGGTA